MKYFIHTCLLFLLLYGCGNQNVKASLKKEQAVLSTVGYAIIIGVTNVDSVHYGNDKDYCGAKTNANYIYSIISGLNDSGKMLFPKRNIFKLKDLKETNWKNISKLLKKIKDEMRILSKPSYLFIYFSGHGASIDVGMENEAQFLCFSDRMVLQQELEKELSYFTKQTKIYVVIDACESGNNETLIREREKKEERLHNFSIDHTAEDIFKNNFDLYKIVIDSQYHYQFDGEADLFITSATNKYGTSKKGRTCQDLSTFTQHYLSKWRDNRNNPRANYEIFSHHNQYRNNKDYFMNSYPLIFK